MTDAAPSTPAARPKHEFLIVNLILLGLIAIFFAPALRPGRVLAAADLAFTNPAFEPLRPPGWTRPHNPMLFDHAYLLGPWRHITWPAMREGRLPLWNPLSYCGSPLAGSAQAMVFSPINWLTALMPFSWGFLFLAAARMWIAGLGTYLLARHYGLIGSASLLAAIAFMFCGFQVVWLMYPIGGVAAWLPFCILAADKFLSSRRFAGAAPWIAMLALITGMHWTGGHPETSVDLTVTLALYAALRIFGLKHGVRNKLYAIGGILFGSLLGLMLAAPAILSFLEWLPLSGEFASRSQDYPFRWIARSIPRRLLTLPLLIAPDFFGNPIWPREWTGRWIPGFYPETVLYIGTLPLILALGALLKRFRNLPTWAWIWLIIGAFSLARALQVPPFDWFNQLPILQWAHFTRIRFVFCFALCLMAGFGAELLIREIQAGIGGFSKTLFGIASVIFVIGFVLAFACPVAQRPIFIPPAAACVSALLCMAFQKGRIKSRCAPLFLIIIASFDLIAIGARYNTIVKQENYFPNNPLLEPVKADPSLFRATALDWALIPDQQLALGFPDIRGMDFQTAWYARYMALSGRTIDWLNHALTLRDIDSPLLRVLNLKYVIKPLPAGGAELETLPQVQPRGFMVYESFHAANDDEAAARLVADPAFVLKGVLLPKNAPSLPLSAQPHDSKVECLGYQQTHSQWLVETEAPGYLVITDSYYPGWRAFSADSEMKIERANIAFRAIYVPEGAHRIEFRYAPAWAGKSILCVLVSLALVVLLFAAPAVRKFSRIP